MYFYAQQVDIDKVSRRHSVVLDVATVDDHVELAQALGGQARLDGATADTQASMLRFDYMPSGSEGFKEGSWYDVDLDVFSGARYELVQPDSGGATILRANLLGVQSAGGFSQFLAKPRVANVPAPTSELVVEPNPKGDVTLTVVNCGHGNWNEISTTADRVIYDVGASRWFTRAEVRAVVAGRNLASETRPISIVISHWDVDHYHALLEFEPAELARLRVVVTPSQIPDTATYKRVLRLLTDHGVALTAEQPAPRTGTSKVIALEPKWSSGIFTLFRATPGRSRNQTGIVLGVRGPSDIALLTGDHHYDKVLVAARKIAAYRRRPCILVAPHHGGAAGDPCASDWLAYFARMVTPISCGANSYGHPIASVEAELKAMQAGTLPLRTKSHGTWSVKL